MNLLAYLIYLLFTWVITVHAGHSFYKNGRNYLLNMLDGNEKITDIVNRLLLTGYYMINLGYVTMMISYWNTITSIQELVDSVCFKTGKIMVLLACMHYFNLGVIYIYHQYHLVQNKFNH
ncbi:MAG: hypothetical protein ABI772_07985 [Bacteroidota bacterium]